MHLNVAVTTKANTLPGISFPISDDAITELIKMGSKEVSYVQLVCRKLFISIFNSSSTAIRNPCFLFKWYVCLFRFCRSIEHAIEHADEKLFGKEYCLYYYQKQMFQNVKKHFREQHGLLSFSEMFLVILVCLRFSVVWMFFRYASCRLLLNFFYQLCYQLCLCDIVNLILRRVFCSEVPEQSGR